MGWKKYTFRRKISDFGVDFSHLQTLFFNDIFNHALVRPFTRITCTLYYLIGNRVLNIYECCFTLSKHKMGEGGNVSQFWTQIGFLSCE